VVDVRQRAEWKTGHIQDAIHIPLSQLSNRQHQLPTGKTIVTVCRSGHRSALAARTLTRAGHAVPQPSRRDERMGPSRPCRSVHSNARAK
jgi:rhodanese-related sulfurtransferase